MPNNDYSIISEHNHNESKSDIIVRVTNTSDFMTIADVFKQLGDPTRIRIFWLLCHCEECVSAIAEILNMTSPAVSHHLRVLKDCNLITSSRHGKEVYYKVSSNTQSHLMHEMIEQIMDITCPD